tara:strand:+ start:6829 stop:8190 length:1362 start_codon:yes stop_codon:yes gene_type:complete
MSISTEISDFIYQTQIDDFVAESIETAKIAILDCIACLIAGSKEPIAKILCDNALHNGGNPHSSVLTQHFKTTAQEAALINGAMAHALDYDDVTEGIKVHPSVFLVPVALALGEYSHASGKDFIKSYLVGFETACSVGAGLSESYFDDLGWHPTGPLGSIGSAATASSILKLNTHQTSIALALAASQASGLRQNFGSMAKPFHPGLACKDGVLAAQLALSGFTADENIFEGRFGFLRAFSGGENYSPHKILESLKETSHMLESGVEIKKYPCCGSSHLSLDAIFKIIASHNLDINQISRITSWVDFDPPRSLVHYEPKSALEGKFSMQYLLSAALVDHQIGLDSFSDNKISRPEIQALMNKVVMTRHPGNEGKQSWMEGYHKVDIQMANGETISDSAERHYTGSLRGATKDQVLAKFLDCAETVYDTSTAINIRDSIMNLEQIADVNELIQLF